MAQVKITETVLRDSHQSLVATRMKTEEMLPILAALDKVGYHSLEAWGGATFDSCLRFLNEDPWERLRKIRAEVKNTKLQMLFRGQNILGYRHYSDDVVEYFVQKSIANGIDILRIFDALNDARNLETAIKATQKEGGHVQAAISYTTGPTYTLEYYTDYAKRLGVKQIASHFGYLYENPMHEDYQALIAAIRDVAEYCKANGQKLLFETGQETPVTLRRVIEDVGTGNLGINLDPANLILYGKGNPIDALDVFGQYVRDIHAKDGKYPTNGHDLGEETVVGKGKVNFPLFIERLKEIGYNGTLIIEREIWGEQQIKDINDTKIYLEELIG